MNLYIQNMFSSSLLIGKAAFPAFPVGILTKPLKLLRSDFAPGLLSNGNGLDRRGRLCRGVAV